MGKVRKSQCCCGQLSVELKGDPKQILACSCDHCQRRTGAVMQHSAWFFSDQIVSRVGEEKRYEAKNTKGDVIYIFCPECGSTVYWEMPRVSRLYGVELYGFAVGNFAEPDFPQPQTECWSSKRHHWVGKVGTEAIWEEFPEQWPELN